MNTAIQNQDSFLPLQDSRRMNAVLNAVNLGSVFLDTDFKVIEGNHVAKEWFTLVQKIVPLAYHADFVVLLPLHIREDVLRLLERCNSGEQGLNFDLVLKHSTLDQNYYKLCFEPVFDKAGKVELICVVIQDLAEVKQAEAEKKKLVDNLIIQNKSQEQFNYIISHNLRSPVVNIIGLTYLLKNSVISESERNACVDGLVQSAAKLDEVINDLGAIIQLKSNDKERYTLVNLRDVFDSIKTELHGTIVRKKATLHADFSSIHEFLSVKTYIYSIFYNLISNSLKYSHPEIPPVVFVRTVLDDDEVKLIFSDNGLGFDLENQKAQLFGLYKRFHLHVDGKGMGLFMVKSQVELLNGTISINSKPGEGATFTISLKRML